MTPQSKDESRNEVRGRPGDRERTGRSCCGPSCCAPGEEASGENAAASTSQQVGYTAKDLAGAPDGM
jgi:hypothetical protein